MGTVLDRVAAVQLEFIVYGIKSLLCVLISTVLNPPAQHETCICEGSKKIQE